MRHKIVSYANKPNVKIVEEIFRKRFNNLKRAALMKITIVCVEKRRKCKTHKPLITPKHHPAGSMENCRQPG